MIAPLVCLLLPAARGCSAFVDYVPTVPQLVHRAGFYDAKNVDVEGRVRSLQQWRSQEGRYVSQAFYVCVKRDCVHVFVESAAAIRAGETVRVRGAFYRSLRKPAGVSRNQIEATEILPRD